jgi:hypothetical protein
MRERICQKKKLAQWEPTSGIVEATNKNVVLWWEEMAGLDYSGGKQKARFTFSAGLSCISWFCVMP